MKITIHRAIDKVDGEVTYFAFNEDFTGYSVAFLGELEPLINRIRECGLDFEDVHIEARQNDMIDPALICTLEV